MAAWWTMAEERAGAKGKRKGKRPPEELGNDYRVCLELDSVTASSRSLLRPRLTSRRHTTSRSTSMSRELSAAIHSSSLDMAPANDLFFTCYIASPCCARRAGIVRAWDRSLRHCCATSIQRYAQTFQIADCPVDGVSAGIRFTGPAARRLRDALDLRTWFPWTA